jgi:hypothetical protein
MKNSIPFGFWFFILLLLVVGFMLWRSGHHRVSMGIAGFAIVLVVVMVGRLLRR